jgi:hypothetical protein
METTGAATAAAAAAAAAATQQAACVGRRSCWPAAEQQSGSCVAQSAVACGPRPYILGAVPRGQRQVTQYMLCVRICLLCCCRCWRRLCG